MKVNESYSMPVLVITPTAFRVSLVLAFATIAPSRALAQSRDPVAAEALFRQGLTALKSDDWGTACEKFQKSMGLDPAVSTEFKLAKCYERNNALAKAWYAYELARKMNRESSASDRRRAELEQAIAQALETLRPRIPTLRLTVTPVAEQMQVKRDGESVPLAILGEVLPLDPGTHEVWVRASGFEEYRQSIDVAAGHAAELQIQLVPVKAQAQSASPEAPVLSAAQAPAPTTPTRTPMPVTVATSIQTAPFAPLVKAESRWGQRQTGFTVAAVGVVTLGVAGLLGLRMRHFISEMDAHKKDDGTYGPGVMASRDAAVRDQNTALVLVGVGAAATGIGLGLYLTGKPNASPNQATARSTIRLLFEPTAIGFGGAF